MKKYFFILLLFLLTVYNCNTSSNQRKPKQKNKLIKSKIAKEILIIENYSLTQLLEKYNPIDFEVASIKKKRLNLLLNYTACDEIKSTDVKLIWSGTMLHTEPNGINLTLVQNKRFILPICKQKIKLAISVDLSSFNIEYIILKTLITNKEEKRVLFESMSYKK